MNTLLPGVLLNSQSKTSLQDFFSQLTRRTVVFFILFFFTQGAIAQSIVVTAVTPGPVCAGSNIDVTFSVTNGVGGSNYYSNITEYTVYLSDAAGNNFAALGAPFNIAASYNTTDGGITSGLQQNITIPVGTATGSGYRISISSSTPGFDGSGGANASSAFSVNARLTPAVSISANPVTTPMICAGTSVTFTATPTNGGTSPSYQWYIGGTQVGSNSATFTSSTLINTDQVSVVMTSNYPCLTTPTATSNIITITVNPVVVPTISIRASQTVLCAGASVTFSVDELDNGGLTPNYQWQLNGNPVGGANAATYTTSTLNNNDIITLLVISSAACASPATVTSAGLQVTVNPNLPASVSIASSDIDNTICAGENVTFTATPVNGGAAPSYQWYVGATPVGTNSSTFSTTVLTSGQSVTVVMTSNAVCATGNPATSNAIATVVNPNLPVSVNITSSDGDNIICAGTGVTFTATPTNGGTSPTYQWYVGPTPVGSGTTYTTSSLTTGHSVTVVMTSNAVCATGSPATSNAIATVVNPNLPASVIIYSSDADNIICAGTSVTFTAAPTNGGAAPTYQWYVGATPVGSNSYTYTTTALTTGQSVTVVMTSNAVCATANPATSNAIATTVNPNLPASVSIVSSDADNTICAGTNVTFTATPLNGGAAPAYQWYEGPTAVGTNSPTYSTTALTGGQSVTVVMTSNAVCATGSPATSNAIATTVNPNLPASVNISSSDADNVICAGTSVTFTATPTNGGAAPIYQWYVGAALVGSGTTYTTSALTTGQSVTVVMTSNAVCATGSPATSNAIVTTVNPNLPVSVSVTPSATTICAGTNVTFTANPTNGGSAPSYQWKLNGANVGTNSNTYSNSALTNGQVVTVVLTSSEICATGNPATSPNITMTVNPNLPVSVVISSSDADNSICAGTSVTFTATPTNGGATPAYQWKLNGVNVGSNSSTYTTSTLVNGDIVSVVLTSNATPCATGNPATSSNTIATTVLGLMTPSVSIVSSDPDSAICDNTSVTFTATPVNGGASPTYQWRINGVNIGTPTTSNTFTRTNLANGDVVTVIMTSNVICPSPATATSNPLTTAVYSSRPDNIANNTIISPTGSISICPPATGLVYTVTPVARAQSYVWTLPAGFTITSGAGTNTITVSVSSGATVGNNQPITVYATNPCGPGNSRFLNVNVNTFAGINAGADVNVCVGGTITLAGIWSGNTASSTWTAPSGTFSDASLVNATYTPSITSGSVTLTITTNDPTGTCSASSDQMVVTIVQPSVAPTSITGTPTTICSGSNTTLTQTGGTLGTGASWKWYSNAAFTSLVGTSVAADASLSVSPTVATTYYLRAETATPGCAAIVAAPGSITINVNTVSVAPTALASASPICNGSSVTLTQTGGTLGTGASWKWYSDAAFTTLVNASALANASLVVNPTSTTTYYLRAESTTGAPCAANVAAAGSVTVIVNTVSVAPTGLYTSASPICNGSSVTLTQTGGSLGTGASWKWYTNAGFTTLAGTSVSADASYSVSPTVTTTYYLRAESSTGAPCAANVAAAGSVIVTVNQPSVAPTGISAAPATICSGSPTTLTQTGGTLGTGASWKWYTDAAFTTLAGTSASADASLTLSPTSTTTYYLRAESTTGAPCTANVAAAGSVTVTVSQPSIAPASISGAPTTICSGSGTTLTQTGGTLGTGASWKWYSDAAFTTLVGTSAAADASLSVNLTVATTYYLRAETSTPGCAAIIAAPGSVTINVNTVSVAPTALASSAASICNGSGATLTQTGGTIGTGASWKWYSDAAFSTLVGTSALANASLVVNPTTTTTYYLRAESTTGAPCAANVAAAGSVTVIVNTVSVAPTGLSTSASPICNGSSVTLMQTGGSLGTGASWKWYTDDAFTTVAGTSASADASLVVSPTATTTYYLRAESTTGAPCTANIAAAGSVTVTVNQPSVAPTGISAAPTTICSGSSTTLTQSGGTLGTGASWKWYSDAAFTNLAGTSTSANASLSLSPTTTTTYYLRAESLTGAPCAANVAAAGSVTVTVNGIIAITSQPAATQTICSGENVSFSVTATGTGLNYQWRKGTTNLVNGGNISGATSATLSLTNITTTDAGLYNVVITGVSPCNDLTSNNAVLIVNRRVAINTQPVNVGICASSPASFGVVASGDGLTYQWYKGTFPGTPVANGGTISGAQSNILNFTQAFLPDAGIYYVQVSGLNPCTPVRSTEVTLNVDQSISITTHPVSQTVCPNGPVSFTVVADAGADPITLQWRKNGVNISGASGATYTIPSVVAADGGNYDVVVSGLAGYTCPTVTSQVAVLTVNPTPTVNTVTNQTFCNNASSAVIGFSGAVAGTVYNWTNNNTSIGLAASGAGNITSFTATNAGTTAISATITVTPSYTNGGATCTGTPTTFTITVNPTPTVNSVSNQVVCAGGTTTAVAMSGAVTGTVYNWTNNNTAIGLAASGTGNIASFTATNTGSTTITATITVTPSYTNGGATCSGTPVTFTITVNPSPTVNTVTNQTLCNNASATAINFSGATAGTVYNWTNNNTAIGLAASGTGDIASFIATNSGTTAISALITVTPSYTNGSVTCTGTAISFNITVNPTPAVNTISNQVVCAGGTTTAVSMGGTVTGTVYNWTNNNTAIGLPASGTGNIASFTATNSGSSAITATITVTPSYTNGGATCTGTATTFTITVNPSPTVNTVSNQTFCNNAPTAAVSFSSATAGTVYNWTNSNTAIGLAGSGSGDITSFTATNTGTTAISATITVTPSFTNGSVTCTGTPTTFTITVNPTPNAVATPASQSKCSGIAITTIALTGNVATTTYNWTRDNTANVTGIAASGSGNITGTLVNTTSAPITVTFTITPSANGCNGTAVTATVTVNPIPNVVATPSAQTKCSGTAITTIALTGNVSAATYNWTRDNTSNVTGIATNGSGDISGTLTNTTNAPVTVTFTITPNGAGCNGNPITATVLVNPTATITSAAIGSACSGIAQSYNITSSVSGSTYLWSRAAVAGISNAAVSNQASATITETLTNSTSSPVNVIYTITPSANSCTGTVFSYTVTVHPIPNKGTIAIAGEPAPVKLVCPAPFSANTATMSVSNFTGTIAGWQMAIGAGAFTNILPVSATSSFTVNDLDTTTRYRAIIQSGPCSTIYSDVATVSVVTKAQPSPVIASPSTVCAGEPSILSASVAFNGTQVGIADSTGNFNQANPPGWCVDGQCSGSALPASGNNTNNAPWQETNGPKTFAGVTYDTYDNTKFAITGGTFATPANSTTSMTTATFNLVGLPSASLNFYHAYKLEAGASIKVEISTDGGITYTSLFTSSGPNQLGISTVNSVLTGTLQSMNISLNDYLGLGNLKIRFTYIGSANSSWAIDGISVPNSGMNASYVWTQVTPGPSTLTPGPGFYATANPMVTTTYQIQTQVGGCPGGLQYVTVTVRDSAKIITQPVGSKVCVGNALSITAAASNIAPAFTNWQISKDNGATWVNITSATDGGIYTNFTTPTLIVAAVPVSTALEMIDYQYRLGVGNSCNIARSNTTRLQFNYIWTGEVSSNWNDPNNWAGKEVPSTSCANVYLLGNRPFEPTLSTGANATINNLHILPNADFTQLNGTGVGTGIKLQIAGHIYKDPNSTYNALDATVEMNGAGSQTIDVLTFDNNDLENLIVSSVGTLTLNGALDIFESVTYGNTAVNLVTNDNLTLKSLATRTARFGTMAGNQDVTGKTTVERYLRARSAWRFLAIPTTGSQTINQAWQEGAGAPNANPNPGYGTQITSPTGTGFDDYTFNPSMKAFNSTNYLWDGVPGTNIPIHDDRGYMLFVRGDRSVIVNPNQANPISSTTLRTKGDLKKGIRTFTTPGANGFLSVGNPFASQIDLRTTAKTGDLVDAFIIWDSYPLGGFWVGEYQTLVRSGADYLNTTTMLAQNFIESGQAFFIQSGPAGAANLAIRESDKSNGSQNVSFAPPRSTRGEATLWAKLVSTPTNQPVSVTDGLLINFSDNYSTGVDRMDVKKFFNAANNLSVLTEGYYLVAERTAHPRVTDSIQLIVSSTSQQDYRFDFEPTNMEAIKLKPYLHDKYLNKYHPIAISTPTSITFNITADAGSKAINRFKIVFKKSGVPELELTLTDAARNADRTITLNWSATNEQQVEKYEVERSADGRLFSGIITTNAEKNEALTLYSKTDIAPLIADNYYRVKATRKDGILVFSDVIKVSAISEPTPTGDGTISVYPNPIKGKKMNIEFRNKEMGKYQVQLVNSLGQVLYSTSILVDGNNKKQQLQLGTMVNSGQYKLSITAPNGDKTLQTVFVE